MANRINFHNKNITTGWHFVYFPILSKDCSFILIRRDDPICHSSMCDRINLKNGRPCSARSRNCFDFSIRRKYASPVIRPCSTKRTHIPRSIPRRIRQYRLTYRCLVVAPDTWSHGRPCGYGECTTRQSLLCGVVRIESTARPYTRDAFEK